MEKKKGKLFEKGHSGYYRGKKIDPNLLIAGFQMWTTQGITLESYARLVNVSVITLKKDLNLLFENGYLPGYLMKDGKRFVLDGYTGDFDKYDED